MKSSSAILLVVFLVGCNQPNSESAYQTEAGRIEHEKIQSRLSQLDRLNNQNQRELIPSVHTSAVDRSISPAQAAQLRQMLGDYENLMRIGELQLRASRHESPELADQVLNVVGDIRISIDRIRGQLDRNENEAIIELEVANLMQLNERLNKLCRLGAVLLQ